MCKPQVSGEVYQMMGVKVGEKLPRYTSIGSYTVAYYTKKEDAVCGQCATIHDDELNPIILCGVYEEGDDLECVECGCVMSSTYGAPVPYSWQK